MTWILQRPANRQKSIQVYSAIQKQTTRSTIAMLNSSGKTLWVTDKEAEIILNYMLLKRFIVYCVTTITIWTKSRIYNKYEQISTSIAHNDESSQASAV